MSYHFEAAPNFPTASKSIIIYNMVKIVNEDQIVVHMITTKEKDRFNVKMIFFCRLKRLLAG